MQPKKIGLLFLHGYPLDRRMWDAQVAFFRNKYTIVRPDFASFQWSTMAELADQIALDAKVPGHTSVEANLDTWPEKWIVCGLSMGGYVALEFWKRHRDLVAGLVLSNTKASVDDENAKANRRSVIERAIAEGSECVTLPMIPKLLSALTIETQSDVVAAVSQMMRDTSIASIGRFQRAMIDRQDFTDAITRFDLPALVIAGSEDGITPAGMMESMADRIPQSSFRVISNAGHVTPMENPRDWNDALAEFAQRLEQQENA
ncbi:MAG: alpha/beta fold hydrolase [Planctomycetota bacterium]|nr:alpha/beta fold hydrolase [Planctomycetota bacterium]